MTMKPLFALTISGMITMNKHAVSTGFDTDMTRAGSVGVWAKADCVTLFDDFSCGAEVRK